MKPRRCFFNVVSCLSGAISVVISLSASAETWNVNASGNWGTASNWTPATVPDGVGAIANLTFAIDATRTVTLDSARTVGVLSIGDTNNSHAFALSGANTLTMDNGGSAASITAVAGSASQTISVPISLASSVLTITNSATSSTTTTRSLTLSGAISAGTAGLKDIQVNGTITSSPVVLSGNITNGAGTVSISKTGAGTLTLSGASNNYNGGVTLGAGVLNVNSATALGTGTLTINGGTIGSSAGSAVTVSTNNVQTWGGNFSIGGSQSLNLGTGAVTLTGNRSIAMANPGNTTVSTVTVGGAIGDGGSGFSLATTGTAVNSILRLTGTNTYTGGTTVNGALVRFINAGALPTNGTLTIGSTGAVSVSGIYTTIAGWTGDVRLSTASTGALALQNSTSENFNASTSGFNTLSIGADAGFTVVYTGAITAGTSGYFAGGGGGSIEFSNADAFSGSNTLTVGRGGGGRVILSSANSYTGQTDVVAGTVLDIRNSGALGTGAGGTVVAAGGGIELKNGVTINEALSITGTNSTATTANVTAGLAGVTGSNVWAGNVSATVTSGNNVRMSAIGGSLLVSGNVALATSGGSATGQSLVLTGDSGTGTISGVISSTGGITTPIIKNGSSTWTLSGANTFTGVVRMDDGVLSVSSIGDTTNAGNLGQTSSALGFGEGATTGTLRYTGTGEVTARAVSLRSTSTSGAGGGIIEQAGTGVLEFSAGVSNTTTTTKTVTLTGSTAGTGKISGVIGATNTQINVVKSGTGAWEISNAANAYTGTTTVNAGTLTVTGNINSSTALNVTGGTFAWGASDVLAGAVNLSGGLLQTNGFSDALGVLTVTGASQISMAGPSGSIIAFGNSSAATWTGAGTLSILNWTGSLTGGGADQITFDSAGLTVSQLSKIFFVDPNGNTGTYSAVFVGNEIVPGALIPEPSVMLLGALGGVGMALRRRRAGK